MAADSQRQARSMYRQTKKGTSLILEGENRVALAPPAVLPQLDEPFPADSDPLGEEAGVLHGPVASGPCRHHIPLRGVIRIGSKSTTLCRISVTPRIESSHSVSVEKAAWLITHCAGLRQCVAGRQGIPARSRQPHILSRVAAGSRTAAGGPHCPMND